MSKGLADKTASTQELWRRFNREFFRKRLPAIEILWSSRLTASLGVFVSRSMFGNRDVHGGEWTMTSRRCIRLSLPLFNELLTQPSKAEQALRNTLVHEMIHQWQFDILKQRPNHGLDFRAMMARVNARGLAVTVYHAHLREVTLFSRYLWTCIECGERYRRQRRTINPRQHRCGRCRGKLQFLDISKSGGDRLGGPNDPSPERQLVLPI